MVLETGLPFETIVQFTPDQFFALRQAVDRRWNLKAALMGADVKSATPKATTDDTARIEAKVQAMKKATGKTSLNLWEVI